MTTSKSVRLIHRSAILQIAIVMAGWLAGEVLVRLLGLPIPGSVAGFAIILALLVTRRLSATAMRRGAGVFLSDLLLLFMPATLAVLDHQEFLGLAGLKVLFVILGSTVAVMLVTGLTVDLCYRWRIGNAGPTRQSR
ncbi:CidA/LrgA family protein [Methyloligella sp. 2.7D]|uniref:CidA/LrgA family protein n=1 Tax=unclassified Methyloligella TaxID=2625955 RepID=UPI00157D3BFD|nr:CidA/LrgA family protein [Methyloligella sp. GL2]QKP76501.1 CidA/LrgA family protein [Methyloligella sp. GL2]